MMARRVGARVTRSAIWVAGGSRGNRIPPLRAELILRRSATAGRQIRGRADTTASLAMMARRVGARVTRSALGMAGGSRSSGIPLGVQNCYSDAVLLQDARS